MNVEKLLTYHVKDFMKLMPGKEDVVVSPALLTLWMQSEVAGLRET